MSMGQRPRRRGGRTSRFNCRIIGGGSGGFRTLLARFDAKGAGTRDLRIVELGNFGIIAKDEVHIFAPRLSKIPFFFENPSPPDVLYDLRELHYTKYV